ncbi:LORF2 protein, partial [Crocuta crocuta]
TQVRMAKINNTRNNRYWPGCGERSTFLHCGDANWYSHSREQYGGSSKKTEKVELPYIPAIGLYLCKECKRKFKGGTCTPIFIVALPIAAKSWKVPKCPLTNEWIK